MKIDSIGWLNRADGDVNLTPCIDGNAFPTKVRVTAVEFAKTNGDKEAMIELALSKLEAKKRG